MRALDHRADHHAWTTVLPRNLSHRRIADREIRGTAENCRESLSVAAGGAHFHIEAVLLEDAGVHANVKIDVTEIMNGFAEAHFLERRSSSSGVQSDDGSHRQATCNGGGCPQELAAAGGDAVCGEKLANSIDYGSNFLEKLAFHDQGV